MFQKNELMAVVSFNRNEMFVIIFHIYFQVFLQNNLSADKPQ